MHPVAVNLSATTCHQRAVLFAPMGSGGSVDFKQEISSRTSAEIAGALKELPAEKLLHIKGLVEAEVDAAVVTVQKERNESEDELLEKSWWGKFVKKFPRRAKSLEECKIWIYHSQGDYPVLVFTAGDDEKPSYIYGKQIFLLRNQWDDETTTFWDEDAQVKGVLDTIDPDAEDEFKALMPGEVEDDFNWPPMPAFTAEMQALVHRHVLPTVKALDRTANEQSGIEKLGFRYGEEVPREPSTDKYGEAVRCWKNELQGMDRKSLLRHFKALQLLDASAK
eukprot:s558_g31.t1